MDVKTITLASGATVPALGQGTWYLGDDPATRAREISALRTGVGAGMRLIDTAEMYGGGRSEKLVGEAIANTPREELFLVSKVLPENAGEKHIFQCCDATMKRMGVDYLDLYLLHWRGSVPLAETVRCLEQLKEMGKIKSWGVSNFDIDDMEELWRIPQGRNCQVNQVLYHMGSRGIEYSLLPWMREHQVALMAYCPLAQGGSLRRGLLNNPAVLAIAKKHHATPIQVLLAWCVRDRHTIAIPRTGHPDHTLENAGANVLTLDEEDLARIDQQYAPPTHKMYLDIQ